VHVTQQNPISETSKHKRWLAYSKRFSVLDWCIWPINNTSPTPDVSKNL